MLTASDDLQGNRLRLAVDGPHIVMKLFSRFQSRYPQVELAVALGNTLFVRQELMERRADLAILPGIKGHQNIHAVPLWQHTAVLIVPKNHPWAGRESVTLEQIASEPMVRREDGSMTQKKIDDAFKQAGLKPRFVLEFGSREALCEAVGAGLGCGIVWDSEAQGSTRFHVIPIRAAQIHSTDYIACLKSELTRPVVRAFLDVAATVPGNLRRTGL
jgi:DNA-binding transcriptional LysR family regulator